jgi:hypothetical protein
MVLKATLILLTVLVAVSAADDQCAAFEQLFGCGQLLLCQDPSQGMCLCASQQHCIWYQNANISQGCPCFGTVNQIDSSIGCLRAFKNNNCGYNTTCLGGNSGSCQCPDGSWCSWNGTISKGCPCVGKYPSLNEVLVEKYGQHCMDQFAAHNCPYGYNWSCSGDIGNCACKNGKMCSWTPGWSQNCPCS